MGEIDIGDFAQAMEGVPSAQPGGAKPSQSTGNAQSSRSGIDQRFAATMDSTRGAVNPSQYLTSGN